MKKTIFLKKQLFLFLVILMLGIYSTSLLMAQSQSPSPTPSPVPTCLPCLAMVHINDVVFHEITTGCTDNDGQPDAGEIFALEVIGSSNNACCTGPASGLQLNVSTDYPYVQYIGRSSANFGFFYFYVLPTAPCLDKMKLFANAYISDSMANPQYKEAHKMITLTVESDGNSADTPLCDTTDCQSRQVLKPQQIELENYTAGSGISRTESGVLFLQNEAWLMFSGINWGPRFGTQWYYQRCLLTYSAPGSGQLGKVEWRLDSPTGALIATQYLYGTGSATTYKESSTAIQFNQNYNIAQDIHDLYLIFSLNQTAFQLDYFRLAPCEPAPFDPWYPTPSPSPTPSPTPTPAPLIQFDVVSQFTGFNQLLSLDIVNDYAYIVENDMNLSQNYGLKIVNIANPSAPYLTGSVNTPGSAYDVKVLGNYAYIADFSKGLVIVDISNKTKPLIAAKYALPKYNYTFNLDAAGNYVYMANDYEGVSIVDVSQPSSPVLAGQYATAGVCKDVAVAGNYAFVIDYDIQGGVESVGLRVLDISVKTAPVEIAGVKGFKSPKRLALADGFLYVADSSTSSPGGFHIFDVSQPAQPRQLAQYAEYRGQQLCFAEGNYLFTMGNNDINVFDVSTRSDPVILGSYTISAPRGIFYRDNYLYIAAFNGTFTIVKVMDNRPPGQLGDVNGDKLINIVDALMIAQYAVGLRSEGFNPALADVNRDSSITIVDALMVAQYSVGLISKL